jgi:glyoxylase-like metal-dependent hydrolase (beta-lactamase superfamily II)
MMRIFKLVFSPIQVNTYILAEDSGDCAIIDCGCYDTEESDELTKFIAEKSLKPVMLLNTHSHLDHIFGNNFILEHYGLRTHASELDETNRISAPHHAMIFGMTMEVPPEPGEFISDNQIITFGNTKLLALHVPGHTTGSIAFYSESDNCVFTGDALFAGSIGRTDLPGGNYEILMNSIRNRLFVLPPSTIVYPGHGEATTIDNEIKTNPYFSS